MPTYRTNGVWGSGIGVNLTPAQVDGNFYELRTDLDDVIANPPTADGLDSVTQSGFYLTFHTTLGNELGPIAIPVVYTVWRGDWAPFTIYSAADIFRVVDEGIFSVLQDHTSAATFDPDEAGGSPLAPYYNELIGVSSLPATTSLDELNDVTITSAADDDLIAWDTGSSQWTNRTPGDVLALLAPTLDDLTDVIAPSPVVGQILTYLGGSPDKGWQPDTLSLDDLDDVSVAGPGDGDVLTYQAGSPTGWIAEAPAAIPTTLDALTDVIAPTPSDGDLLQFDGADWVNSAGSAISDLTDAFLPLVGSDLFEISQSTGSPPGSPPVGYESRKATLANILSAGGFTLGSTSIALGGTATTVTGLTLSGGTLSGTTTLPGSGQIDSAGAFGIGAAPAFSFFRVGGTYITANPDLARYDGTLQSSSISNHSGTTYSNIFEPQGASITSILNLNVGPTLGTFALNVPTVVNYYSLIVQSAGYSGVIAEANNFRGSNLLNSNGTPATTFRSFRQNTITNGTSLASGTVTNVAFYAQGISSSAAGGTLNNRGMEIVVPSGGASSGTANNRGIYVTGNGGAASGSPPGTVNNFAMLSDSTAYSRIEGGLGVGVATRNATTATSPYFYIPTCAGTPTGVPRNAAVGATAMIFDDTAHKLWVYEQSTATWKGVVVA